MSLQDLQAKYENFYAPRFRVTVDGEPFTDATGVISDLSVDTTLDGADRFSFTLNYPFDHATSAFDGLDWETFAIGNAVEIWMGYGSALEANSETAQPESDSAFIGKISAVQPDFPAGGTPTVAISGYDLLHDMTTGTKERSWEDTSLTDIVTEVASEYFGEKVEVDETGLTPPKVIQDKKNDYQFLATDLGETYGFELFVRRDAFYYKTREPGKRPTDPIATLRYGESLSSFSPELNDAQQVETVEVRHWDPATKSEIVGTAEQEEGSGTSVVRLAVQSAEIATKIAEAELFRISTAFVSGSGETVGIPELRAGVTLRIEGVSKPFNRDYFVEQATHSLGGSGYTTSFKLTERA
jgi:hypothetical protein